MQGNEIVDAILVETRANPKITNLELAFKLKLHRNTISKYRKYIRQTYYKTPQEIVNKIDSRLDEELEAMSHFALLTYRAQLVPKKAEITTEFKGEVKTETNINILLRKYEAIIEGATKRNLQENDSRKPIHPTHTNT